MVINNLRNEEYFSFNFHEKMSDYYSVRKIVVVKGFTIIKIDLNRVL